MGSLEKAEIDVRDFNNKEIEKIKVLFNPGKYSVEKAAKWISRGKRIKTLHFMGTELQSFSVDLFFDTYEKKFDEKSYFKFADKIVDYIYKGQEVITGKTTIKVTKEEKIEKAGEVVGETRFKPASTEQKKYIYGYRNNDDKWCKGIIESRYIEKPEIREIGAPEKLSLEDATEWLLWWWGPDKKSGERAKREKEAPRDKDGNLIDEIKESGGMVKGDKTSVVKDELVDDINAWRRENFLIDDKKFKEELGYSGNLEKLSEEDLLKIKEIMKHYHPKNWNNKGEEDDEDFIHPDKLD